MVASSFARVVCALASAIAAAGCAGLPPGRMAIDDVTVQGSKRIDRAELEDKVTTASSPKLFGLFRGVYAYELLDRNGLQRDLARLERYYRARGYYEAHARAGRIIPTSDNHVRVEIEVEEGAPVLVRSVLVKGIDALPPAVAAPVRLAAARLAKGAPFDETELEGTENDVKKALTDRAYAYAKVKREAEVDIVAHTADVVFTATPDLPARFGKITFNGLDPDADGPRVQEISELPLRRAINIAEGDPYSTAAIDSATRALLDLEVFAAVDIVPSLPDPPPESHVVPLAVKVDPMRLRAIRLGVGAELDALKTDIHGLIGWEDHNLFGGLRDLSIDFRPGVVLYPTRVNNVVAPDRLLPEERLRVVLRQPGFLEARTTGYIRPELNVFPLLLRSDPSPADPVIGYREIRGTAGADRSFGRMFVSLGHAVQVETPIAYKGVLDPSLSTLVISYPELVTSLDLRDDRVHAHSGVYLANTLQVAGGPFGGDARDVKVRPEVRTYVPVARGVTFATRASVGFLFPSSYGGVVEDHLNDPTTDANRGERVRDIETVYFRGFTSGGPTSNRGYPVRGIAPHGVVPFLNPGTASQQVALNCDPSAANNYSPDPNVCSIPIAGLTLWEFSNEVRIHVGTSVWLAAFCDLSDVSPRRANLRLDRWHMSCGVGGRYDTPVGPLRLDIGYRIQPLQVLGYRNEAAVASTLRDEGLPPTILGLPIGVAFGIGDAY